MTQSTVVKPASQANTCSSCLHFDNFHESNSRGWCELFNHQARAHHEQTNDCITSSDLIISHELEDNLVTFPDVDVEELNAFPDEEAESELDKPYSEYQKGSIVKVIDKNEHHTEWGIFEIIECKYNESLYRSSESYLNEAAWYFRLASIYDASTINKSLWIREDEICHFNMSHNVCTEDIF